MSVLIQCVINFFTATGKEVVVSIESKRNSNRIESRE